MIQIETKFNIGDRVRYPESKTIYENITCPYCKGKGFVEISPDEKLRCAMCDDGIYENEIWQSVWSKEKIVSGAAIGKNFLKKPITEQVYLCINRTEIVPEFNVKYAYEVEEGELVKDENN